MCDVPVFFATTDGQTRRIAEQFAAVLRQAGLTSEAIDIASSGAHRIEWPRVRAVMVGASVHAGAHQRSAEAFVRANLAALNARPSVFFSVSLSICSAIPKDVEAAQQLARAFPDQAGWHPTRVACIGGRLAYRQYGLLKRFVMRRIARQAGGPTDTTRDHEMTDWNQVRTLAGDVASIVHGTTVVPRATVDHSPLASLSPQAERQDQLVAAD